MSEASLRLQSYARMASVPLAAALGTGAAAEITYVSVGEALTGGTETTFAIGNLASFVVSVDNLDPINSSIALAGFLIGDAASISSFNMRFAGGATTKISILPVLNRLESGDLIQSFGSAKKSNPPGGFGSIRKIKSGKTVKSKGEFTVADGPQSGFIGFEFEDGVGDLRYGWISVSWDGSELFLDGYAWENDAGVGIRAGQIPAPGALGLLGLAAGAAGLRRQRKC